MFLIGHAIAQAFAVSWAILPKSASNFARPSLQSFPWRSYYLFASASYLSGTIILLLLNFVVFNVLSQPGQAPPLLFHINPFVTGMVFAAYFPVMTACLSFLTDLHLRRTNKSSWHFRLLDGVVSAFAMATTNIVIVRGAIYLMSGVFISSWPFLYIVSSVGAFLGILVPASAASYLKALESRGEYYVEDMTDLRNVVYESPI